MKLLSLNIGGLTEVQHGGEIQAGHMGVRGVLRDHGPGHAHLMATLLAFMTIFVVSTALNYLVL